MEEKIIKILNGMHPEYDFHTSEDYIADGVLDSFDVVTLVTDLEEQFGISIDGEEIIPENFSNIDAIKKLIEKSA